MKRFSPKQTLSNFVTAVRETVDSVNKKIVVTTALTAFAISTGLVFTQASLAATVAKPPATGAVKATANSAATAAPAADPRYAAPDLFQQEDDAMDRARKSVDAKCGLPSPTDRQKEDCQIAQDRMNGLNKGRSAREDKEEGKSRELVTSCDRLADYVKQDAAKAEEACGKAGFSGRLKECFSKVDQCHKEEIENDDEDIDEAGGVEPFCNKALANKCPGLPAFNQGRDYKSEEKEAKKDAKEAKRDLDSAMKKQREEQMDLAKAQREMRENEEDQALANRDAERALENSLKKALEGLSEDQKAAFEAAQGTFTKMEAEYMKMRKEARDSADLVDQAKDDLQVMCRASAEKKFAEAEKVRLAALAARKKNVGAGTNVSGSSKRTKAAADRARQTNYVAFFNECSSGQSADGVGGNNRIKTAERAKGSADKFLAEKAQLIEKERANMLEKLKQMEADATNRKTKIVEEMNQKLERENENRLSIAKKNAARAAEFSQRQQLAMKSTQDEIDTANKDLMDAQREQSVAGTNLACQGRNGGRSESKRDRLEEGFGASVPAINAAIASCDKMNNKCKDPSVKDSVPAVCSVLWDSNKPKTKYGGSSVKTGK